MEVGRGLINFVAPEAPIGYSIVEAGIDGKCGTFAIEKTIVKSGSNAFKCIVGTDGSKAPLQLLMGLNENDIYRVTAWARLETANASPVGALIIAAAMGGTINVWDKANQTWVVFQGDPSPYFIPITATETYTQLDEVVYITTTGRLGILLASSQNFYADDLSIQQVVNIPAVLFDIDNTDVDIKDISVTTPADFLIRQKLNDSTGVGNEGLEAGKFQSLVYTYDNVNQSMIFFTDAKNGFNFEVGNTPLSVWSNYQITTSYKVTPTQALNSRNSVCVLDRVGESTPIDFTQIAETSLYTVPNSSVCNGCFIESIDFFFNETTYTGGWAGTIGSNSPSFDNYNTWANTDTLSITGAVSLMAGGTSPTNHIHRAYYGPGETIKLNITTGATATKLEAKAYIIGYLL